jgi:hypothetical protein
MGSFYHPRCGESRVDSLARDSSRERQRRRRTPKKSLLRVCVDRGIEPETTAAEIESWFEEIDKRGSRVIGDELEPLEQARTVRVRGGSIVTTDGPFAEAKELIAGFDVLDCPDKETAVELAALHPVARFGAIEVRAFRNG